MVSNSEHDVNLHTYSNRKQSRQNVLIYVSQDKGDSILYNLKIIVLSIERLHIMINALDFYFQIRAIEYDALQILNVS